MCFAPIEGTPERWQELRPLPARQRQGPALVAAPEAAVVVLSVALQFAGPGARLRQLAVTVLVTLVAAPISWEGPLAQEGPPSLQSCRSDLERVPVSRLGRL